ncbi:uncharacterized protein LOC117519271 [Thalassophryne amazonica]|uniref:uncharacterized protein LOC117519271 n=1 Tax=Thalassophryne amazonica TaxID=390379 RepID=UPI00147163B9|nr:uncharacterized protein LOC117519271 [Thalassophryne amazonica]
MANHNPARVVLMFLGFLTFLAAITLNSLSGFSNNLGIFTQMTEDVSLKYTTLFTPAQWTFFVWDFIYFWVFAMFSYMVVGLCRRSAYGFMFTTPAVLPYGFHISVIINMLFNITWLFLFDREMLFTVLITSLLMTATSYMILFFSCWGLRVYGGWLHKFHRTDLWLIRILVQNGMAVYATWGMLCTLLNLTIYLQYQTETLKCYCVMASLLLLLMELLAWFLLENFWLDNDVRYVLTIYPVVVLWLTATLQNSTSSGGHVYIFAAFILAVSCILFVVRIALVTWRHYKRPLYSTSGLSMSPVEIALKHNKLFL